MPTLRGVGLVSRRNDDHNLIDIRQRNPASAGTAREPQLASERRAYCHSPFLAIHRHFEASTGDNARATHLTDLRRRVGAAFERDPTDFAKLLFSEFAYGEYLARPS
jgi:hypothetical protein